MMKFLKATMLLAVIAATLTSCDKELTNTEKLTGTWKMTASTVDPAFVDISTGTTYTDVYAKMDECDKDDLLIFEAAGGFKSDEGTTKCDPSDTQTSTGTWVFNTTETTISATSDGSTEDYKIVSLTETTMTVTNVQTFGGLANYTFTLTFAKQ